MQYLPALLLHVQRRQEGGRGVDRRCGVAVHMLMMRLVERGLARRIKRGTYLIERRVAEEVLTALRQWI